MSKTIINWIGHNASDDRTLEGLFELLAVQPKTTRAGTPCSNGATWRGGLLLCSQHHAMRARERSAEENARRIADGSGLLTTGDRVRHATFGAGVVRYAVGEGYRRKAVVQFADAERTVMAWGLDREQDVVMQ